jgi:2-polyprenyl-3-methyl-5-hydroxy-6-metoxy-1,4-benzoquinol methylase
MSYYTEKQFTKESNETEKTSVLFQTYFSDIQGKILDAGCSVGNFLSLAPRRITGIDFSEESINICKKRGLNAQKMDLTKKLKFKDEEFDGVFSSYVIEHIEKPLPMVKELRRILKTNGKLVIITTTGSEHTTKNTAIFTMITHT